MKNKRLLMIAGIVCLTLVLAGMPVIGSACAGPGGKTIRVGMTTPSTGVAAEKGTPMGHANLDAIEYINAELGGAAGNRIEVSWYDSAYDTAKVVTLVKRVMDEGCILFT